MKCDLAVTLTPFLAWKRCGTEKQSICMFTGAKRITSLSSLLVSLHYSHHPLSQQTVGDLHKVDCHHLHHSKRAKKVQPLFNYSDLTRVDVAMDFAWSFFIHSIFFQLL